MEFRTKTQNFDRETGVDLHDEEKKDGNPVCSRDQTKMNQDLWSGSRFEVFYHSVDGQRNRGGEFLKEELAKNVLKRKTVR